MKKVYVGGFLSLIIASVCFVSSSLASNIAPGSNNDPLVSKSYVDAKFNQIVNMIGSSAGNTGSSQNVNIDDLAKDIAAQVEFSIRQDMLLGNNLKEPVINTKQEIATYTPVSASAGQIVIGGEGTEIILRSGKGVCYTKGENGIVNITTGTELFNNNEIKANNMLLIPRNDGRGVKVTTDAWFIIRGEYQILN